MNHPAKKGFTIGRVLLIIAIAIAAAVFESKARAADLLPVAQLSADLEAHKSMDAAATAALGALIRQGHTVEYGGAIYRCGELFAASGPVTQNLPHDLTYQIARYKECELVGTYHIHPTRHPRSEVFSKNDKRTLEQLNLVGYIGVVYNGKIRKREGLKESLVTIVAIPLQASR